MSQRRAVSSPLGESKLPVNWGRREKFKLLNSGRDQRMGFPRTRARAATISSTAIFRAVQSTSEPRSLCSVEDGSDMGGEGEGGTVVVGGKEVKWNIKKLWKQQLAESQIVQP